MTRLRARSPEEREERRELILDAAEELITDQGFETVSMNSVAARSGLAKGTLYLYFQTREEVFLALHARHRELWMADMLAGLAEGQKLVPLVAGLAREHPVFLMLNARLGPVIEQNLPREALIAEKRASSADLAALITALGVRYDIDEEAARRLVLAIMTAVVGASSVSSWRPPEGEVPADVGQLYEMSRFEVLFAATAEFILAGAGISE